MKMNAESLKCITVVGQNVLNSGTIFLWSFHQHAKCSSAVRGLVHLFSHDLRKCYFSFVTFCVSMRVTIMNIILVEAQMVGQVHT